MTVPVCHVTDQPAAAQDGAAEAGEARVVLSAQEGAAPGGRVSQAGADEGSQVTGSLLYLDAHFIIH